MSDIVAVAHPGSTAGVTATPPTQQCRAEKCEIRAHIGVFFDGTGNNQDWVENSSVNWRQGLINWWHSKPRNTKTQLQQRSDSNVARLFRAYRDDPVEGFFPMYIPGVGTPFKDIGEVEPEGLGAAFGAGGDGRINYGLLHVLNSMYRAIAVGSRPLITTDAARALCSTGRVGMNAKTGQPNMSRAKQDALRSVNMHTRGGLLMDSAHKGNRETFFKEQFAALAQKIASTPKPQLVEVFIDVFGFSRGAAQARVFCNWLEPFFAGSTLAGVTTHIRFLGIFDTVAAVGLGPSATSFTDGHQSWGDAPYLRIPRRVKHCEHYVAMHENRGAFPLEDIRADGANPTNAHQYRFPGMHSDVGGGYAPTDQGRGPRRSDAEKVSQIPLNNMFSAAVAATVPLDKATAVQVSGWDCYEAAPSMRADYEAFLDANGRGGRALKECCMDYLAWRVRSVDTYPNLPATLRASADDRYDLQGANSLLKEHLAIIDGAAQIERELEAELKRPVRRTDTVQRLLQQRAIRNGQVADLPEDAKEIAARARAFRPIVAAEAKMFSDYCHDSFAGFKPREAPVTAGVDMPGEWEPEGYLRYRTRYEGNDTRLTQVEPQEKKGQTQTA
jgi:Uncharacterized alpha/beta hydrolase domain (DUF2235)